MEFILYTVAGIILYVLADRILIQIELRRGAPFANRSIVFFVIISIMAIVSFQLIKGLSG